MANCVKLLENVHFVLNGPSSQGDDDNDDDGYDGDDGYGDCDERTFQNHFTELLVAMRRRRDGRVA